MKSSKATLEQAQKRLRLKSEQLNLRVRMQEQKQKLAEVTAQLKGTPGRIR